MPDSAGTSTTHDTSAPSATRGSLGVSRADFLALTKFRLSALVIVTTFFGFWLNSRGGVPLALMLHTLLGATLAAFGAAIFNQLMGIEPDSRMTRTADRPLPAHRVEPGVAFALGWVLSAFALIHLGRMVNVESAAVTALTLAVYLFVYTPLKQHSAANTIIGAVSGALPPLIGWTGAVGPAQSDAAYFRAAMFFEPGAVYLFLLLFLWQLPHFLAINWMYREEYRKGGFVMWANEDPNGSLTARLMLLFSALTAALMFQPVATGRTSAWFLAPALAVNGLLLGKALRFCRLRDRDSAKKVFLFTLCQLPLLLLITALFWRRDA